MFSLRKFRFRAPGGPATVDTAPIVGFIHRCPEYSVEILPRTLELFSLS